MSSRFGFGQEVLIDLKFLQMEMLPCQKVKNEIFAVKDGNSKLAN
jgi:hypothetical protein